MEFLSSPMLAPISLMQCLSSSFPLSKVHCMSADFLRGRIGEENVLWGLLLQKFPTFILSKQFGSMETSWLLFWLAGCFPDDLWKLFFLVFWLLVLLLRNPLPLWFWLVLDGTSWCCFSSPLQVPCLSHIAWNFICVLKLFSFICSRHDWTLSFFKLLVFWPYKTISG